MRHLHRIGSFGIAVFGAAAALLTAIPEAHALPLIPPNPGTAYSLHVAAGPGANQVLHHGTAVWEVALIVVGAVIVVASLAIGLIGLRAHSLAAHSVTG